MISERKNQFSGWSGHSYCIHPLCSSTHVQEYRAESGNLDTLDNLGCVSAYHNYTSWKQASMDSHRMSCRCSGSNSYAYETSSVALGFYGNTLHNWRHRVCNHLDKVGSKKGSYCGSDSYEHCFTSQYLSFLPPSRSKCGMAVDSSSLWLPSLHSRIKVMESRGQAFPFLWHLWQFCDGSLGFTMKTSSSHTTRAKALVFLFYPIYIFWIFCLDPPHIKGNKENMTIFKCFCNLEVKVLIGTSTHKRWPDAL